MGKIFDLKLVTDVATELLTISDVKSHLYITHSNDDDYLTALITRSRKQIQNFIKKAIGSQEWVWVIDAVGSEELQIPYQPVITVDLVSEKTDFQTYEPIVLSTAYDTDGEHEKTFTPFYSGRFKVEYTTGYTTLPDDLKQAWLIQINHLYENRGDVKEQGLSEMAKDILAPYIDYSWT